MKKTVKTILLLTALLFGFTTCGGGGFVDPGWEEYNGEGGFGGGGFSGGSGRLSFKKGNPSSADLQKAGLSSAQFDAINKAAGGGYKGYYVASASGRAAYQGSYMGAFFYASWGNRQADNFKSLIQEAETQFSAKCIFKIDWQSPDWYTSIAADIDSGKYGTDLGEFKYSDWYMAMGSDGTYTKMWYLAWAASNSAYMGASFKKGDMLLVYVDLSGYLDGYDLSDYY